MGVRNGGWKFCHPLIGEAWRVQEKRGCALEPRRRGGGRDSDPDVADLVRPAAGKRGCRRGGRRRGWLKKRRCRTAFVRGGWVMCWRAPRGGSVTIPPRFFLLMYVQA